MNPHTREFEPETDTMPKEWSRFEVGQRVEINGASLVIEGIEKKQLKLRPETREEFHERMFGHFVKAPTFTQRLERKIREAKTTDYPRGFARPDDEGQLPMQLAHNSKAVLLNFGKPVAWLGFGPDEAEQLADGLKRHADELRREMVNKKPE